MPYHVGRNNQQLGQFTEAEIRDGLQRGSFFTNDLVWAEGMTEWKPLDQVFGFAAAQTLSAPMTVVGPGPARPALPAGYPGNVGFGVMPTPGTAIASLVLGIIGLVTGPWCIGSFLAIPGAICGHMALGMINRSGGQFQGKGLAIAGLVLSYVAIAIGLVVVLFFGLMFGVGAAASAAGAK